MRKVGNFTLLGASGEMSDFQYMGKMIDELDMEDWLSQDGCMMGPKQYASYIGRVMYNRRSKMIDELDMEDWLSQDGCMM